MKDVGEIAWITTYKARWVEDFGANGDNLRQVGDNGNVEDAQADEDEGHNIIEVINGLSIAEDEAVGVSGENNAVEELKV